MQEMTITTSGSSAESRTSGVVVNNVAKEGGNRFTALFLWRVSRAAVCSADNLRLRTCRAKGLTRCEYDQTAARGQPDGRADRWSKTSCGSTAGTAACSTRITWPIRTTRSIPARRKYCSKPAGCLYQGKLVPDSRNLNSQDYSRRHVQPLGYVEPHVAGRRQGQTQFLLAHDPAKPALRLVCDADAGSLRYLYSNPDYIAQVSWTNPSRASSCSKRAARWLNETWWSIQSGYGDNQPVTYGITHGQDILNVTNGPPEWITSTSWRTRRSTAQTSPTRGVLTPVQRPVRRQLRDRQPCHQVRHAGHVRHAPVHATSMNNSQYWIFNQASAAARSTSMRYPLADTEHLNAALGIYAQDRWTIKNLTLNYGLRFDYHNAYVPGAETPPAIPWVAAQQLRRLQQRAGLEGHRSAHRRRPMTSAARHSTVARANWGHYLASESTATATANNPVNTRVINAYRGWIDANGNFLPDCDLANTAANGECGGLSAPLGKPNMRPHIGIPPCSSGWGVRPSDDEILLGVQQKLTERVVLDVQWTRHSFGNLFATQFGDAGQRLQQLLHHERRPIHVCQAAGQLRSAGSPISSRPVLRCDTPNNLVQSASKLGDVVDLYTGFDVTLNTRFKEGGQGSVGVSTGDASAPITATSRPWARSDRTRTRRPERFSSAAAQGASGAPAATRAPILQHHPAVSARLEGVRHLPAALVGTARERHVAEPDRTADPRHGRGGQRRQFDARPAVDRSVCEPQSYCAGYASSAIASTRSMFVFRSRCRSAARGSS